MEEVQKQLLLLIMMLKLNQSLFLTVVLDYTFGTLDLESGGVPTGTTSPVFNVIIPPNGGHGADIYRELGAYNVLTYSRFENDTDNPDFITGNRVC